MIREIKSVRRGYGVFEIECVLCWCVEMKCGTSKRPKTRKIIHQNQLYVNAITICFPSSMRLCFAVSAACCSLPVLSALQAEYHSTYKNVLGYLAMKIIKTIFSLAFFSLTADEFHLDTSLARMEKKGKKSIPVEERGKASKQEDGRREKNHQMIMNVER